eukprot:TRINITY_DN2591_c0_g2_i1.p1 TRINITY_DN2591_c0_g2~~TRINITY_DN2591_c0_g2_i1.p1  ORF type:complete len:246 (+),score=55.32 TRINITY_DN2591_c0_g2_i1:110-847(+)
MSGSAEFGNFHNYYSFNKIEERIVPIQSHLKQLCRKAVEEKRKRFTIVDVGCNEGDVTFALAELLKEESSQIEIHLFGIDLDQTLIQRAIEKKEKRESSQSIHLSFARWNIMDPSSDLIHPIVELFLSPIGLTKFDVVCCFSITMWIHLNYGDEGLLNFLGQTSSLTDSNLIIEPQPWQCYKNAVKRHKKMGVEVHPLFYSINIRLNVENEIQKYLEEKCNLILLKEMGETVWKRKISLYSKGVK